MDAKLVGLVFQHFLGPILVAVISNFICTQYVGDRPPTMESLDPSVLRVVEHELRGPDTESDDPAGLVCPRALRDRGSEGHAELVVFTYQGSHWAVGSTDTVYFAGREQKFRDILNSAAYRQRLESMRYIFVFGTTSCESSGGGQHRLARERAHVLRAWVGQEVSRGEAAVRAIGLGWADEPLDGCSPSTYQNRSQRAIVLAGLDTDQRGDSFLRACLVEAVENEPWLRRFFGQYDLWRQHSFKIR